MRLYSDIAVWEIAQQFKNVDIIECKKIKYYNCACSFDIETSSFYINDEERACMYAWAVCLNRLCIYGREWWEFVELINTLHDILDTEDNHLIIYVHNLAYEFQFIRRFFSWSDVFARERYKPMKAVTTLGIEFKCSYFLTNYSLASVAKNLHSHNIRKLKGDLDYRLIRHSKTPLTKSELQYLENDVLIVVYLIEEEIERNGDIAHIPLTATSYVRRRLTEAFYPKNDKRQWHSSYRLIHSLTISDAEEYKQLVRTFAGGFTHAGCYYSGKKLRNVSSIDFSSSYPAVMVHYKYPMSKAKYFRRCTEEYYRYLCKYYCTIADITFYNIEPIFYNENIISFSKCWNVENAYLNNGRVWSADKLTISITEVDFEVFEKFYKWSEMDIVNVRTYIRGYLPKPFIETLAYLYRAKTELKGVQGGEIEYMHGKADLNSTYGCTVTSIAPDVIEYNIEWTKKDPDFDDVLSKYNNKTLRTLYYPWGVYVTAYARRNLFYGILEFGDDYVYSDTDSIKCLNYERHLDYIQSYNKRCVELSQSICRHYSLPLDTFSPTDKKGRVRHLGVWDYEGVYTKFKTMGAKRYLWKKEDTTYFMTVSGVRSAVAIPYLLTLSGEPEDNFNEMLNLPAGKSGKMIHTYIDDETEGIITDYLGNTGYFHELSSIHLKESGYDFSLKNDYIKFLENIHNNNIIDNGLT